MRTPIILTATALAAVLAIASAPTAAGSAPPSSNPARSPATEPSSAPAAPATVLATAETPELLDDEAHANANADDPAIWVHPDDAAASLVIATAKNGGLFVYDLTGAEVQHLPASAAPGPDDEAGRLNNVDIVYGFDLGGTTVDVAVASDRGMDLLRTFRIDSTTSPATLEEITADGVPFVFSADQTAVNEQATTYGLATWMSGDDAFVLTSQRHGTAIAMLRLAADGDGVGYEHVADVELPLTFTLGDGTEWTPCDDPGDLPQVEGMVVDGDAGILYAGQEDVGIWRIPLAAATDAGAEGGAGFGEPELIERVREFGVPWTYDDTAEECVIDTAVDPGEGGDHIAADVEGLTIYDGGGGSGYLLASSQGDSTFVVFERDGENAFVGTFAVGAGDDIDSAEHSDGAMVTNVALGDAFPQGLLVTHDGENEPATALDEDGEPIENTNFKFVPWQEVAGALPGGLLIDTTGGPPR